MITLDILAPEFVKRFQSGEIPENARVVVTFEDDEVVDPAVALIEQWLSQAPSEPALVQDAEDDLLEFQQSLNSTRREAGARPPYASGENS